MINLVLELTRKSIEIIGIEYLIRKRKRNTKMLVKIQASDKEVQLIINALAEHGKPIIKKAKPTMEDKRNLKSIENIIHQLAFGNHK